MSDKELYQETLSLYKSVHEENKTLFRDNSQLRRENVQLLKELSETRKVANLFRDLVKGVADGYLCQEQVSEVWDGLLDQAREAEEIENAQDSVVREALALINKDVNK